MAIRTFGPFRLIAAERLLAKEGVPVGIGGRTLDLLIALTDRAGLVVSVRELLSLVWPDVTVEEASLRVCIATLRKTLGDGREGARYIVNVAGRGYVFVAPIREEAVATPRVEEGDAPRTLPPMPRLVVGRDDVIGQLARLLVSRRFVSVVGPGGMGKTTVALAVAHRMRQEPDGFSVAFVDAASLRDADDLPRALAAALGWPARTAEDPLAEICARLAQTKTLVVLDGCEPVIGAAAGLAERLLQGARTVRLLVTSREALRVEGENVHLLAPLHGPPDGPIRAAEAMATPAVQLFMEKAAASGHRGGLSDADAARIARVCRRLDGMPLAIELVASRLGTYGVQGMAALLDGGGELSLEGRRDALPRHQTLKALHDWSFDLLSADEQRVLSRLSVFGGELTLAAAHAVAGEGDGERAGERAGEHDRQRVAAALASLVDKSLLLISAGSGAAHYRLRHTTRAYAAAKLAERREEEVVVRKRYAASLAALPKRGKGERAGEIAREDVGRDGASIQARSPCPTGPAAARPDPPEVLAGGPAYNLLQRKTRLLAQGAGCFEPRANGAAESRSHAWLEDASESPKEIPRTSHRGAMT